MNYIISFAFYIVTLNSFGQVIDTVDSIKFELEVISTSRGSSFVLFRQYANDTLTVQEERIIIQNQNCQTPHGKALYWYNDGKLKSEGYYHYGAKKGLWKYWDLVGTQTQDIDTYENGDINIRGGRNVYYYIDGIKTPLRE